MIIESIKHENDRDRSSLSLFGAQLSCGKHFSLPVQSNLPSAGGKPGIPWSVEPLPLRVRRVPALGQPWLLVASQSDLPPQGPPAQRLRFLGTQLLAMLLLRHLAPTGAGLGL